MDQFILIPVMVCVQDDSPGDHFTLIDNRTLFMTGHLEMNAAVRILYNDITASGIQISVAVQAKAVLIWRPVGGFEGFQAVSQDR